jgi:hypothetical protein
VARGETDKREVQPEKKTASRAPYTGMTVQYRASNGEDRKYTE